MHEKEFVKTPTSKKNTSLIEKIIEEHNGNIHFAKIDVDQM